MEIFGGFMVMMGILGFFLAVVWLVLPFVVLAIKGKVDRILDLLEDIEKRLCLLEQKLNAPPPVSSDDSSSPPQVSAPDNQ